MPLPEFANEKDFREKWIAPFLSKMGFILPKHVHGADEQGKDFFFAEHDRFGHLRVLSAQAKVGDIGTGRELGELLDQIGRSFEISLKYHKGAHDQRISGVYVMTNGKISPQARERIWEFCRAKGFGENVYFLDGETLDNLDRFATQRRDDAIRQQLVALMNEANYNITPITLSIQTFQTAKPHFYKCRVLALEEALRNPLPEDIIPYSLLSGAWSNFEEMNKRSLPFLSIANSAAAMNNLCNATHETNLRVRDAAYGALQRLDERYSLTIEVVKK